MTLCLICLRTDKTLKRASDTLEEFYNELCDAPLINMTNSCYYCKECDYILKKFYKFKEKCVKAWKIYQKWKSEKASKKQSIDFLYRLLPPSALGVWANIEHISVFTLQVTANGTIFTKIDPTDNIDIKQECDQSENISNINILADHIKSDNISEINQRLNQFEKMEDCIEIEENLLSYKLDDIVTEGCPVKGINKNTMPKNIKKIARKKKENVQEIIVKSYNLDEFSGSDAETINDENDNTNLKYIRDTEDSHKKVKSKKCVSKKIATKNNIDDSQAPNDHDTNSNKTYDTKESTKKIISEMLLEKKMSGKKKKEKGVSKKCLSKKITAKMKAYYDKAKRNDKMYESVFDIEYLTTQEMMLDEFQKRQTYECYIKAEHKCEICFQTFKSLKFLEYHTKKWHTERPGSVYCPICKIWSSKSSTHRLTHTMVFRCRMCTLVTYHRLSMKNHFEWHRGKQYRCEECDFTCKSKSAYRSHVGRVHRRGVHVCTWCGRGFRSALGLRIHATNTSRCAAAAPPPPPPPPPPSGAAVRCEHCRVTLRSQQVYVAHISDVHNLKTLTGTPSGVSSAGLPPARTYVRRAPKFFKKRRSAPFLLTCRLCGVVGVAGWCQLQQHYRRHHPGADPAAHTANHLCDVCGAAFTQIYGLRDHMNKHTGARPYGCDLCPKRFRSAYLRRAHRVRHFPSTLPCPHCSRQFKSKGNLYCHVKTHTGEKNHKCNICGKGFIQATNLREHVRGVHNNIRRRRGGGEKAKEEGNGRGDSGFGDKNTTN